MTMPRAEFKITGEIDEFERVDNLYRVMKREGSKLLTDWLIEMEVKYSEKEGEKKT